MSEYGGFIDCNNIYGAQQMTYTSLSLKLLHGMHKFRTWVMASDMRRALLAQWSSQCHPVHVDSMCRACLAPCIALAGRGLHGGHCVLKD